ncbi:uncharacterized protein FIBRA_00355 [Fibroporia radiculosa]|uniref:Alpha/beta hydrolase fold-3 domain-containing protein n=1 Tax=Fibroporia radiculosa TaxID=599839 RepID=J7RVF0_9APHY|nr:uncharacterized protein FIBRA_00355 [Fibroporia radiculosa]CCL98360.1 predicted protein [Fibroporia radiculosa]
MQSEDSLFKTYNLIRGVFGAHKTKPRGFVVRAYPTPAELIIGDLAQRARDANVKPVAARGFWIDKEGHDTPIGAPLTKDEKVVLFFHSGEFSGSTPTPSPSQEQLRHLTCVPRAILAQIPTARRALAVEYRLCELTPVYRDPFPAALLDALAAYAHLLSATGVSPQNVVLVGEAAGGHLALALARYLATHGDGLARTAGWHSPPPPASPQAPLSPEPRWAHAMVLLSPWCDLGTSHDTPGAGALAQTYGFLEDLDPRPGAYVAVRRAYGDPLAFAAVDTDAYLSPASLYGEASFAGFPRTFVAVGRGDRLVSACRTLGEKMGRDLGPRVVLHESSHGREPRDRTPASPRSESVDTGTLEMIRAWLAQNS